MSVIMLVDLYVAKEAAREFIPQAVGRVVHKCGDESLL
jgi:hypothetical protein